MTRVQRGFWRTQPAPGSGQFKRGCRQPFCEFTMSFVQDNADYEAWLAKQCDVVADDIKAKHKLMKSNAFMFLRATYFRWAKKIGASKADTCRRWRSILRRSMPPARPAPQRCGAI